MVITNTQMRRRFPSSPRYARLLQSTWACSPGAVSNRTVASAACVADRATRRPSVSNSRLHSPGFSTPGAAPRSSPTLRRGADRRTRRRGPAWTCAVASASASWLPESSGTGAPCCGRCSGPRRSPGWNGPPPSSRRSLSLVPPSAMCVEHLHEVFVNDALAVRWVNTMPAISLIFTLALPPRGRTAPTTLSAAP